MSKNTPSSGAGKPKEGNRLYNLLAGHFPRLTPWLHIVLFFLVLLGIDLGFRFFMRSASETISKDIILKFLPFSLGWSLLLTAIAMLLPRRGRQVYMIVLGFLTFFDCLAHGVYINMFRRFFSFSDLAFAGDGAAFLDLSYLMMIRKLLLLWLLACFAGAILAALLVPPEAKSKWIPSVITVVLSIAVIAATRFSILGSSGAVIWNQNTDPAFLYEDFSDTRANLIMLGIYQYTFRDIQNAIPKSATLTDAERSEIEAFAANRGHEDNEMSGIFEGKNLILVQLEAIDTWMLDGYMPHLKAVKEQSISFSNHYTPAYITAGTFNTEFMVNCGLLPAASGTSPAVYTRNACPNSLAHLFRDKGYHANSFHGSSPEVYNRGPIHLNWGYEAYHSGTDMGMENYMMDSQLMGAADMMLPESPFFTFIITYSGHGAYSDTNPIYLAHEEEAKAAATRTDGNYVYAVGHAMETDLFIEDLMETLESTGHLDDTVVIFYPDHYNYYMLDDTLQMEIKGVDTYNMLQHTDWFIYCKGMEPRQIDKYTSSIDVLPTIANLFGLDAQYELLTGDDAFSQDGGYVFFTDNTWTGTDQDVSQEIITRRRISGLLLSGNYWAS